MGLTGLSVHDDEGERDAGSAPDATLELTATACKYLRVTIVEEGHMGPYPPGAEVRLGAPRKWRWRRRLGSRKAGWKVAVPARQGGQGASAPSARASARLRSLTGMACTIKGSVNGDAVEPRPQAEDPVLALAVGDDAADFFNQSGTGRFHRHAG